MLAYLWFRLICCAKVCGAGAGGGGGAIGSLFPNNHFMLSRQVEQRVEVDALNGILGFLETLTSRP